MRADERLPETGKLAVGMEPLYALEALLSSGSAPSRATLRTKAEDAIQIPRFRRAAASSCVNRAIGNFAATAVFHFQRGEAIMMPRSNGEIMFDSFGLFRRSGVFLSALCMVGIGFPAAAQEAGTYSGQTADGNPISFSLGSDPNTGKLELTSLNVTFKAQCAATGTSVTKGYYIGLATGTDVRKGKVSYVYSADPQIYISTAIDFPNKTTASGSTGSRIALLIPGSPPSKAQLCVSQRQAFQAAFQTAGPAPESIFDSTPTVQWSSKGVVHQITKDR